MFSKPILQHEEIPSGSQRAAAAHASHAVSGLLTYKMEQFNATTGVIMKQMTVHELNVNRLLKKYSVINFDFCISSPSCSFSYMFPSSTIEQEKAQTDTQFSSPVKLMFSSKASDILNLRLPEDDAATGRVGWKEKPLTVSEEA